MGIHTGDSIVVAPSQTLTNREFNNLRSTAQRVIRALGIIGECNIQFALDPQSEDFRVIRSQLSIVSQLSTGLESYWLPIAYIAPRFSIGYTPPELTNKITGVTRPASSPPNYIVVKARAGTFASFRMPARNRHPNEVSRRSHGDRQMLRKKPAEGNPMLDQGRELRGRDLGRSPRGIRRSQRANRPENLLHRQALKSGFSIEEVSKLDGIDPWFIDKIRNILLMETESQANV